MLDHNATVQDGYFFEKKTWNMILLLSADCYSDSETNRLGYRKTLDIRFCTVDVACGYTWLFTELFTEIRWIKNKKEDDEIREYKSMKFVC